MKSKYKQIEYIKSVNKLKKPWKASIIINNRRHFPLGVFETEELAIDAYNFKARDLDMALLK